MDFSVEVKRVIRILDGALGSLESQGLILSSPKSVAYASRPNDYGIEHTIRFYHDPSQHEEALVRTEALSSILRHLRSAGLSPSLPKQNVFVGEVRMRNMEWHNPLHRESLIAGFSIFSHLEAEDLAELAARVIIHEVSAGDAIITEGEETTSMYGLAEGFLEVRVAVPDADPLKVGEIIPGEFFGEMSMLVGEPRAATVIAATDSIVFETTRQSFSDILTRRSEVGDQISRVIAERQLANSLQLEASAAEREAAINAAATSLVSRMKSIFSGLRQGRP